MSLPSGYKRLEYIQSTGTQYVDTGFKPNQNSRVVADFQLTASGVWQSVFGAWKYTSDYVDSFVFLATSSNFFRTDFGSVRASFSSSLSILGRHIVDHNKTSVVLDSTSVSHSAQTFSSVCNLNIFAGNTGGTASEFAKMKLYSCQIYDNGTLVRDFIPCQKSDGAIGLWDDVNSVFYGNAGTGTFTAGPIVVSLSKITELEYIQSSGTQYIDTGYKPTGATKIVCDFQMVNQGTNQQGVFGSRPGASGRFTVFTGNGTSDLQVDYGTEQTLATVGSSISGLNTNNRTTLEVSNSLVVNGTTIKTVSAVSFTSAYNLFLFANNNIGSVQLQSTMKLYSCQIYDNGTLVRDYIAAKLSDGTVGLYDKLHGLLYINVGTGTFTAGPVKEPPPAPATLQHLLAVRLAWSAVDGATKYNVYRDGTLLTSTTETTFIDLAAAENTEYTYAVSAVGPGGESAKTTLTVYTKSGYFLYKPYIESATFQ